MRQPITGGRVFLDFAGLRMDMQNECLWRGETMIRLQRKTFAVLRYLVEHPNRLIEKQELLKELWGNLRVGESVLKTHLNHVRSALSDNAKKPSIIETVHGRGYRFIPKVFAVIVDDACAFSKASIEPRVVAERWVDDVPG